MRRTACLVGLSCTLCLIAGASDQGRAGRLEGEKVSVMFGIVGTPPSAATFRFGGVGSGGLTVGASARVPLFGVDGEKCGMLATFGESAEQLLRSHPLVYAVDVKVVDAVLDEIHLAVDWRRYTRPSGARRPAVGDHLDVTLKEGQRMVLDVIDRPAFLPSQCAGRNFMLEMTPSVEEDPAFADRQIAYDLWLVHEQPNGQRTTFAWKASGKQGQELTFQFPDRVLGAPGQASGDSGPHLRLGIKGEVRGRLRQDGRLDLGVDLTQQLALADGTSATYGNEEVKRIRIQPGETIRIDIPLPQPPADHDGQTGGYQQCLQGHTLGLILTATPLQLFWRRGPLG